MPDGMGAKRFRVAFSFAGEKREFVEKVAALLARQFGKGAILYDKFHEAEFARRNLGIYLPDLYHDESDLVVVIVCPDYDAKQWTGLEWAAIHALLSQRKDGEVMLGRFGRASVAGLYSTAGFSELDDKTPEQFADLILERLALNEGKPKDYYLRPAVASPAAPHPSIRHNLPTLQPFFGREEELRKIAAALNREDRTWGALIDGPGGMGKTSLAVRAAHDASPEDFRRIAFVSLKTRELDDDGVRDLSGFLISGLAELFNELARELGHAEVAKAPEDQRPRLLIEALRDTQTLLVLDNLESLTRDERGQLFTFVKRLPQGCKAVLTARGRIGSGAEELILEKISEAAALATLEELATRNPALAKTSEAERIALYTQTAGKPLLLRWTAGQIGRGHCRTSTDAIAYLRSCPEGNDPLEFIFGDLVDDFSESEARVLCALSYFTLPAKVDHICALSEALSEVVVETALKSLANRSLVVPSEDLQTFALVPMVADFLRKKRPETVAETGDQLEKHAYALVVENGFDQHERFYALEAAWPAVAAAVPRFLVGPNDRLQIVCDALKHFLNFTGRWDERLGLFLDAQRRAVGSNDFFNAGWRAYEAGYIHALRGQATEALACAERAEAHWQTAKVGDRERAIVLRLRGHGYNLAKDYPAAIAALRESLELDRALEHESVDVAIGLNTLASAEKASGDHTAADRDFREALRIAQACKYVEGVATYTGNLAGVALDRKDWAGAEVLAREALMLAEKIGRQEMIASDCHRLAYALVQQGRKEEARPHAERAVEVYARLGSPDLAGAREIIASCEV